MRKYLYMAIIAVLLITCWSISFADIIQAGNPPSRDFLHNPDISALEKINNFSKRNKGYLVKYDLKNIMFKIKIVFISVIIMLAVLAFRISLLEKQVKKLTDAIGQINLNQ